MSEKPRPISTSFFNRKELGISIFQGLIITAGTLFGYQYSVQNGFDEAHTRTLVFIILVAANIFLTLVNRSFYYSIFKTIRYKNTMVFMIIGITLSITALLLYVPILTKFFEFEQLSFVQLSIAIGIGFVSVIWIEFAKMIKRFK